MTFLNSAILAGLFAVAVPVILHFLLKQKPKKLIFPALRLIEQRRRQNVRRLRLRHLWLMLLRMLVLAGLVFALARPSLPPANYGLSGVEIGTLLVVVSLAVGSYLWLIRRWKSQLTPFLWEARRASFRGWMTGGTLLALLLLVVLPYQQRIAAEITDPTPAKPLDLPVAGIFLFDSSLSMEYQQEGQTRLDVARRIAKDHLEDLPAASRIAVADTASDNPILFPPTMLAAQSRLDALETHSVSRPLDERLRDALRAHTEDRRRTLEELGSIPDERRKDRFVRRIYLFTDLSATAWRAGGSARLQADLDRLEGVNIYLIDVGVEQPQNASITDIILSRERVAVGGDLIVSAVVDSIGLPEETQTFELLLTNAQGASAKHGQAQVKLEPGSPARLEFPLLSGVTGPLLHGEVRYVGSDPLTIDNVRYFTASVTAPPKVLVVSSENSDARELLAALAPHDERNASQNKFDPVFTNANRLREADLSQYTTVCLVNVSRLADAEWYRLGKFVEDGGGLAIFLGSTDLDDLSYNRAQAQAFLPASLDSWQPQNEWNFQIKDRQHPLFWKFRQYESYGAFATMETDVWVGRFWKVQPAEGAGVIATYTDPDQSPAILERVHGRGRTVMVTTAVNLPDNYRQRWTNLPSPLGAPWLFVAFAEQLTEYVSRFADTQHNYTAGETPSLPVEPQPLERQFLLREPQFKQRRVSVAPNDLSITIEEADALGHYELVATTNSPPLQGFSVNLPGNESNLTRMTEQQLNDLLGEGKYQLARTIDELKDEISTADLGQEVFPFVLMLLVTIFLGEHLVANRFYDVEQRNNTWAPTGGQPTSTGTAATTASA